MCQNSTCRRFNFENLFWACFFWLFWTNRQWHAIFVASAESCIYSLTLIIHGEKCVVHNQSQLNHKTKHNTHKVNEKCSKWACLLHLFLAFNYSFCVVYISCIPKQREREGERGLVNTVLYWHFREKWLCLRLYLGTIPTLSTTTMLFLV